MECLSQNICGASHTLNMETASEEYYEEPWGQLLAIEGGDDDRIPIIQRRFTIGRNKGCLLYYKL